MRKEDLLELLSAEGLRLLDSLHPYDSKENLLRNVSSLRAAGHSAELVTAVLTQARLRQRARRKFGDFADRMLFTEAGLEQATRLSVAALHAGRYQAAGYARVADLGAGVGADSLALAALDIEVTAVEVDEVTAALTAFNLAPFGNAWVEHADATAFDLTGQEAVFLDPARRTSGHTDTRRVGVSEYSPPLAFAWEIASRLPTAVKLGPGFDRSAIPDSAEAQWISVDGETVELALWFGGLARSRVRRSALVVTGSVRAEMTATGDSADEPVGELGAYLHEPAGAVIRARLLGDLARATATTMVSEGIAYLTGEQPLSTPLATSFRIEKVLPLDEKAVRAELRARSIGRLEVKKRGVDIDPAEFRKRVAPAGDQEGTVILTRIAGRRAAILAFRC